MRSGSILIVVACLSAARPSAAAAQDTVSQRPDTVRKDSVPPPPPPTPAQERYANGLRHVSRGIAQLKDGLERVSRTRSESDSLRQRTAGRRLGGLCAAARGFLASGRAQMSLTAYDPPTRTVARQLAQQIDSLIAYAPTCERTAARRPSQVADRLTDLLRKYEAAVASWRTAVGLPNR